VFRWKIVFPQSFKNDRDILSYVTSPFIHGKVRSIHSSNPTHLESNYIYLVDPLGNIFMRYPLIDQKDQAPHLSKKLRQDILHLFKYSRLG
jgi:hypothetical protein